MAKKFTDEWACVARIDPDANAAGTILSDEIDLKGFDALCAVIQTGDLGASATLDAKFRASTTSGGTYADVTGKAVTQLTQAGTDDNKIVYIELDASETTGRYVKLSMTVATATSDSSAIVFGRSMYRPATGYDLSAVDEVVL